MKKVNWYPWTDEDVAKLRDMSQEGAIDADGVQCSSGFDARGHELPDPVPVAPPVGFSSGPSLADFVQRMIRQEVSMRAAEAEMETFEEADDFEIEDDPVDPLTPYEKVFDKQTPADWPMYYNPETGFSGQLPPTEKPPEGFVALRRVQSLPEGWELPEPAKGQMGGIGKGGIGSARLSGRQPSREPDQSRVPEPTQHSVDTGEA